MELFRILCMFLVLFFHVYGFVDILNNSIAPNSRPLSTFTTQLLVSATFGCVDVFILLSGWYGINTKASKIAAFVFQVLFYSVISYLLFIIVFPDINFSPSFLIHIFILDDYWFVPIYLLLYIFAPALNDYIRQSGHLQFKTLLITIIAFQCVYGWLNPREAGLLEGRSPFSFIILYMLAGYLRRFPVRIKSYSKSILFLLYAVFTVANALLAYTAKQANNQILVDTVYQFSSPLIIAGSVCLLLLFNNIKLSYNKTVNWIAASSFAAFLIHCFPLFIDKVFKPQVEYLYHTYNAPLFILLSTLYVVAIYVASILIDQVRLFANKSLFRKKSQVNT